MRATSLLLVTCAAALLAGAALAQTPYFRVAPGPFQAGGPAEPAVDFPGIRPNDVPGTGALAVSGPGYVRAPTGSSFTQRFEASGASGPVTWTVSGNPLPPGMTLSPNGTLTGRDVAPGSYPGISATATDASGRTGTVRPFDIVVGAPSVSLAQGSGPFRIRSGDPFVLQGSADGVVGTPIWSLDILSGSLPTGVSFDESNGRVVAGSVGPGSVSFLLSATGLDGTPATVGPVSLDVASALAIVPTPAAPALASFRRGQFRSYALPAVSGARGDVSYALGFAPPQGLTLSGGTLSGAPGPNALATSITGGLGATDAWDGSSKTIGYEVRVDEPMSFPAFAAPASIALGGSVAVGAPAMGGLGQVSYSLVRDGTPESGAISACTGLGLDANGRVAGTATAPCTPAPFSIRATDAFDLTTVDTLPITLSVVRSLAILTQPPSMSVGVGAGATTRLVTSGRPVGTIAWTVELAPGATGSVPSWLVARGCDAGGCNVDANPPVGTAKATYPSSGGYRLRGVDSGQTLLSDPFTVTVNDPATAVTSRFVSASGPVTSFNDTTLLHAINDGNARTHVKLAAGEYVQLDYAQETQVNGILVYTGYDCTACTRGTSYTIQVLRNGSWVDVETFTYNKTTSTTRETDGYVYASEFRYFGVGTVTAKSWRYVPKTFNVDAGLHVVGTLITTLGEPGAWNYQP
jgi:hypothetical protein